VFVEDVVDANIKAACSDAVGVFNIGTGRESSVLDIFRLLKQYVGKDFQRFMACHTRRTTKKLFGLRESKRCAWLGTKGRFRRRA